MSKYCVSYETMKLFITSLNSNEIDYNRIEDLVRIHVHELLNIITKSSIFNTYQASTNINEQRI